MKIPADAPILTVDAVRAAELACVRRGTSLQELMERAGRAVADVAWRVAAGRRIWIYCGTGNNGGDGYVAARLLAERGADVQVAALGEARTDLARAARARWGGAVMDMATAAGAVDAMRPAVLVDALFGVGMSRPLDEGLRNMLAPMAAGARVISVDVPSGVDADGLSDWAPVWPADITLALGALKAAHVLQPSAAWCGTLLRDDLGEAWAWESDARTIAHGGECVATPSPDAHKFTRGMVLVASGPMRGAAHLCAAAAMRAGAGYVVMRGDEAGPFSAVISEGTAQFSQRFRDKRVGAAVIGAGYPDGEALRHDVAELWGSGLPLVLDAAAIDAALPLALAEPALAERAEVKVRYMIMTPHEGEFQRAFGGMMGKDAGNKIDRVRRAAALVGAVVIYKGADMVIAAPDGRVCAAWPGSPWLASAGTGDVLAGACGAMLARGGDSFQAAVDAVRWHIGTAQRIGPGLIADDMIRI